MALSFGQVLAGAGAIARGQREARSERLQNEARQAQLEEQQMRLNELRRLHFEQELARQDLRQKQPGFQDAPLLTAGLPMDPTQARIQAQAQAQAQQQATEQEAATQTQPQPQQPYSPMAESPLALGARYLAGYPQRQAERFAGAEGVAGNLGAIAAGAGDIVGSTLLGIGSYAESLGRDKIRRQEGSVRDFLRGAGLNVGEGSILEDYDRGTGRIPQEPKAEAPPAQETATQEAAAQPPVNEQNPATAVSAEGPPRPGVSEQTRRILSSSDFYLGNPNAITPDMQRVMDQRQELVRMAEIYRRNGMVTKYQEAAARIQEADDSLVKLQGMRGISELLTNNNPLRLEQVLSYMTGQTIRLRPSLDGTYDYMVPDANGTLVVAQTGVTPGELANRARNTIDAEAAAAAEERNAEFTAFAEQERIKTINAINLAVAQGEIDRSKELAKDAGIELVETAEKTFAVLKDASGNTSLLEWGEEIPAESSWFGGETRPQIPAGFRNVRFINTSNVRGNTEIPTDNELLANWNG